MIILLPKPSGEKYYRPSVIYQLRKRELDLRTDCDGDIKLALRIVNNAPNNEEESEISTPENTAFLVWNGYQIEKSDIRNPDWYPALLLKWCSSQKSNIKIYFVDSETGKVKDAIFPNFYQTTIGELDGRGLFQHGNRFEAVTRSNNNQDENIDNISVEEFIKLWKKFREERENEPQKCAICLKRAKLSNSHIIPYSVLCMATTSYHRQNKCLNPSKVTEKLLCAEKDQGCEQMLASVEKNLCEFLAGPTWNKSMEPTEIESGLIYDFQQAVKECESVKFTITMKVWHALISIAYRVLITWTGKPEGKSETEIKQMEKSLGRLAKTLHCLTIYPYDEQAVYVWLLLSPSGTKAIETNETELYVKQVVPFGNDGSIIVHFGLRGLHFIVTDLNENSLEVLSCDTTQCVIPDQEFVIPYLHFEQNGKLLQEFLGIYKYTVNKIALASSLKVTKNSTNALPEIQGNVERLPTGFNYTYHDGKSKLKLSRGWNMCCEIDTKNDRLSAGLNICEKMWIVQSPKSNKLNAVFSFVEGSSEGQKYEVFGYSLSSEGKIEGPMVGTRHTGTFVDLKISGTKCLERIIQKYWDVIKIYLS